MVGKIATAMINVAPRTSYGISALSCTFVVLLTMAVAQWHSEYTTSVTTSTPPLHRFLVADKKADDDLTRDDICKEYLMNFLNGTTDARDECDGMLHAYQAADCADDKADVVLGEMLQTTRKRHHDDPAHDNVTQDDVLIDDFYEAWQCCSSIYEYYTGHCHEPQLASFQLLGVVSVLVICGLVKSLIRAFQLEWIPDAAACILVGAVVGGIVNIINPELVNEKLAFNNNLFLHILLPPIVFQSALTIDKRAFRRDLFPILAFAVVGTFLSALAVGYMTHYITSLSRGTTLPLLDSLLFGSLISSIDPVATLSILAGAGVSQTDTLYTLIFGESLLNDGVAIVLFDTLVRHLGDSGVVNRATVHETLCHFFKTTFASMGIGLACGIVCTAYFAALRRKHTPVVEVAIFFCWALIPYYISDGIGYSGIISIMTTGFFLDFFVIGGSQSEEAEWMDYMEFHSTPERVPSIHCNPIKACKKLFQAFSGRGHISKRSRLHVGFVAEVIASIMETAIFAYLGLFLFNDKNILDFRLNLTAIFGCVTSRAMMVLLISVIINIFVWLDIEGQLTRLFCTRADPDGDETVESSGSTTRLYLDNKTQQIILLAGVRGAVSFALVENIPIYDAVTKQGSHFKAELKAMTSCSILFTVFVFGALTYFLVRREKNGGVDHGPLQHRLSEPLLSVGGDSDDDGDDNESDLDTSP